MSKTDGCAMYSIQYVVNAEDVDRQYRHVHHARAVLFMERARLALLESAGFPDHTLIARNLYPMIASIHFQYLRELREGPITVTCDAVRIEGRSIFIDQRIINGQGKDAVRGVAESMVVDGARRRAIAPPQEFVDAVTAICGTGQILV